MPTQHQGLPRLHTDSICSTLKGLSTMSALYDGFSQRWHSTGHCLHKGRHSQLTLLEALSLARFCQLQRHWQR